MVLALAVSLLSLLDGGAKFLSHAGYPVLQIVWARFFFQAVVTVPVASFRQGRKLWRVRVAAPQALRGILHVVATFLFFTALGTMPLADTLAIYFAYPFVVTALAPLLLGEAVGARRWIAVAVGFLATLLIIRPGIGSGAGGLQGVEPGAAYALAGSVAFGLYILLTRKFAHRASTDTALAHQSLAGAVVLSLLAPMVWTTPDMAGWLLFGGLGVLSAVGHGMLIRAFSLAPASMLAPIGYVEIIAATAVGYVLFGDFPDPLTWAGIAIIAASGIYIAAREGAAKRHRAAGPQVDGGGEAGLRSRKTGKER